MVDSPDYIAFRAPDGDALLTIVAALEPGERGSFAWATWYSTSAPSGEFRKVPGGYARFAISESVAYGRVERQKFEIKTENQKRAAAPTKKN